MIQPAFKVWIERIRIWFGGIKLPGGISGKMLDVYLKYEMDSNESSVTKISGKQE